jgi:hypothetical protein
MFSRLRQEETKAALAKELQGNTKKLAKENFVAVSLNAAGSGVKQ